VNKANLKRKLSQVDDFENPRVELEQYQTPPSLAADIVYSCYMQGHEKVVDLGTGTGILAIGAGLLGLDVKAVEIDSKALDQAQENAERLNVEVDFVEKDVTQFGETGFDAVVMNPPFNVQSNEGVKFWEKGLEVGDNVFGVAGKGFETRLKRLCNRFNHEIVTCQAYTLGLPPSYEFHLEESRSTPVDVYVTKKDVRE